MIVFWVGRLRGFLRQLSDKIPNVIFEGSNEYYEVNSRIHKLISRVIRLPLFNPIGLFKIEKINDIECDCYGSFNRFLKCDKPYFIYLENPTALYHYTLGRINSSKGKDKFRACLDDYNLKYIICMSKACFDTFEKVNGVSPLYAKMLTIYPLVRRNMQVNEEIINQKSYRKTLECLYCVQGVRFVSKGGLEVLSAIEQLRSNNIDVHLTIITKIKDLNKHVLKRLKECEGITLHDFCFNYEQLEFIYANTNVLLQPSSDDSFSLTVLEAMKGGCAIIASELYGFKEMVEDDHNGFLIEPKYWFFDHNNIPNPKVWNHRNRTIYSKRECKRIIDEISEKISSIYYNRDKLNELSLNSFEKANSKYDEKKIYEAWRKVFDEISKECGGEK